MIQMVLDNEIFNNVFVSENGELLLQGRLLLLCDIQLQERSMDIVHNLKEIVRKTDVNPRTIDKFVQSVVIKFLDKMA